MDDRAVALHCTRIALAQQCRERLAHRRQVGLLGFDGRQLVRGQFARFGTGMGLVEFEQAADLFQCEAQCLRPLDEAHALDRGGIVAAISVGRLVRLRHQTAPLVVADGLDIHAGLVG
ncbi:Uncharacterised protein [Klebsiella pneumoniae]|nr:Uncharacterised protein [Klebsiella pneumoniae]